MATFACVMLVLGLAASAGATTWYVPSQCPTIQAGIDSAATGDTVLVADGTYTGPGNRNIDFLGKGILVTSENGPEVTIVDCEGLDMGFAFRDAEDSTSVLRGFTIQNGSEEAGGGIYCFQSSSTIEGNRITACDALGGGGIYCAEASPTIRWNQIVQNTSVDFGGGIACESNSSPTICHNQITLNSTARDGGGIYCMWGSSPTIEDNEIELNSAVVFGGGIFCSDNSSPAIEGNYIGSNTADDVGGGIFVRNNFAGSIVGNTIVDNMALGMFEIMGGGGIYCEGSIPVITRNEIIGNYGADRAGGVYCNTSVMVLDHNAIVENTAEIDGGGIYCYQSGLSLGGNTIANNTASANGGGVYCVSNCDVTVWNTILWGDSSATGPEIYLDQLSVMAIRYSDVEGGTLSVYIAPDCTLNVEVGNIDDDPLFVSGYYGDYYLSQTAAGQGEDSPCVDAGDPAAFLPEGTTRTDGLPDEFPVDMGFHYPWNRRPDLVDQADTSVAENQYLTFTLGATDPDGDSISFSSPDLPSGATLDAVTGVFEWTPTYQQVGLYTVTFIATDFGIPALADTEDTDITVTDVVGVEDGEEEGVRRHAQHLAQNYPNPFGAATTILYSLRARQRVSVAVYDIRGALVRQLVDEAVAAGVHRVIWDGVDGRGRAVGSGIYFCRLAADDFRETRRMVLLR